jgi:hypothetical protein
MKSKKAPVSTKIEKAPDIDQMKDESQSTI